MKTVNRDAVNNGAMNKGAKNKGKVYLIGAGPGDVELLTIKGMRCLQECDVILIDDLVNAEILQFAKEEARIIEVGKRGGARHTDQEEIFSLMISSAEKGLTVGRLKGGDPFIFGRGGEEVQKLRSAGIDCQIVSGITAGVAVPASLGIPLTHREFSSGVTMVTGHSCTQDNLDWRAISDSKTTLVIYMGMSHVDEISTNLRQFGMRATMPVAIIENGTLPSQRAVLTDLENLPNAVQLHQLKSPSIIVIGEVVNLNNQLAAGAVFCTAESLNDAFSTQDSLNSLSLRQTGTK